MYYIIQKNLFSQHEKLVESLDRLNLPYELVDVLPFIDTIDFKTNRTDVFCFGALKMARLYKQYNWYPGCLMTPNHDYMVYKDYYKENLLNYDSKIYKFIDDWDWSEKNFFIRPVLDSKVLVGKVYTEEKWLSERNKMFEDRKKMIEFGNENSVNFTEDTEIQVASIKQIQKEFRFWIIGGEIITGSLYKTGNFVNYSNVIDDGSIEFCKKMIKLFELAKAFVMDICLINNEWKIVECGAIGCCGFYHSNIPKILMALENHFNDKI